MADFEITHESKPSEVLIAGFSNVGLAGLTAADFLVTHLELVETGHVDAHALPSITPFVNGRPRHHTRLFSTDEIDLTVLVSELFVPIEAANSFSQAVLGWVEDNGVEEVVVFSGVPIPHGPEEHRTFYVATEDYPEHRLTDANVPPMGSGFLDGVNGALVERGMNSDLRVSIIVTPVHRRTPDVEAAIRLVETVTTMYDVPVDVSPLETFARELTQYYTELHDRLEKESDRTDRSLGEDRMFM